MARMGSWSRTDGYPFALGSVARLWLMGVWARVVLPGSSLSRRSLLATIVVVRSPLRKSLRINLGVFPRKVFREFWRSRPKILGKFSGGLPGMVLRLVLVTAASAAILVLVTGTAHAFDSDDPSHVFVVGPPRILTIPSRGVCERRWAAVYLES